uniref:Sulfotransferase family protein n=1 Tax=Schlesneria paludicola TaxID=360056 RepID=A0A7C4LNH4_9PLAN
MGTVINVCGPSFSGTTMLELMLANSPTGFCCGEVAFWYRPLHGGHRRIDCSCGAAPCPVWPRLLQVSPHRLHAEILRTQGVELATDSSKRLSWTIDVNRWAGRGQFRVVNCAIWKQPAAYVHSHWKRGAPLDTALRRYVRYYQRLLETGLPLITVNYEQLVQNPAECLHAVCLAAGIDYFPGKEAFWRRTQHQLYGNQGTRRQLGREDGGIQAAEQFCEEFHHQWRAVGSQLTASPWQHVLSSLVRRDVLHGPPPAAAHRPRWIQPPWYYRQRLHDGLRRAFRWYRPLPQPGT